MNKQEYLKLIDDVIANGQFKDTWESLSANFTMPEWYKNAKFGLFSHWGVYSVPAFGSEWYARNMYEKDSREYKHHIETYGAHKDFGYKDFIPMFKAEKFNADEWLDLIEASGAKYYMPVAEHHDGFQMYKSDISKFNAAEMGPMRDICGELKAASEKRGIQFCVSSHRIEHWFFMGGGKKFDSDIKEPLKEGDLYWPSIPDADMGGLNGDPSVEFMEDWLIRCCELVDKYQPKIVFFDWWIQIKKLKPYLKKFVAYYYNRAKECGYEGIVNYKFDALIYGSGAIDMERGQCSTIKPDFWQTDTCTARNSWSYTENNVFKSANEILCDIVDIVSKNGCMLLNIGPKADGTICDEDKKILLDIGSWFKANGESIYNTLAYKVFGEGPTEVKEGHFTDNAAKGFTSEDIRFTFGGNNLYATVLSYPQDGTVRIKTLSNKSHYFYSPIKAIEVLGFDEKPEYERTDDALIIKTTAVKSDNPVVFKIIVD